MSQESWSHRLERASDVLKNLKRSRTIEFMSGNERLVFVFPAKHADAEASVFETEVPLTAPSPVHASAPVHVPVHAPAPSATKGARRGPRPPSARAKTHRFKLSSDKDIAELHGAFAKFAEDKRAFDIAVLAKEHPDLYARMTQDNKVPELNVKRNLDKRYAAWCQTQATREDASSSSSSDDDEAGEPDTNHGAHNGNAEQEKVQEEEEETLVN